MTVSDKENRPCYQQLEEPFTKTQCFPSLGLLPLEYGQLPWKCY